MLSARTGFLTPPPGPTWLASGAGAASTTSPDSFTDTIPAGANCTLVFAADGVTAAGPTISATVGGVSTTQVTAPLAATRNTVDIYLACFALFYPPTGSQTISFSTQNPAAVEVTTLHYKNVTSIGTPVTSLQQAGSPSMSATSTVPQYLYVNAFVYGGSSGNTYSGYSQTQRFLAAQGASNYATILGEAPGNGGTLTFSASRSSTTFTWGGVIIPIL